MSEPDGLLDDPAAAMEPTAAGVWAVEVEQSLSARRDAWLGAVDPTRGSGLGKDRAWRLLNWVEWACSEVVRSRRNELVEVAGFALVLACAGGVDPRDVQVVACLLRRAADLAGLDYAWLIGGGCARAGDLGSEVLALLLGVRPAAAPAFREVGRGTTFRFERVPADFDPDELVRQIQERSQGAP